MNECFALVYTDYEGLELLALGDKEFVFNEYKRIKNEIKTLHKKYNYNPNGVQDQELPDEFYLNDYCFFNDLERLCIQGYKDGKIECVCEQFEIKLSETKFY